jgi:glycosyltransferase involved in cell wall biosynthesis
LPPGLRGKHQPAAFGRGVSSVISFTRPVDPPHRGERPHVLLVSNTSWSIANFRSRLICRLMEDGYRVTAVAPLDEHTERVKALGCGFEALPMDNAGTNPLKDLALLFRLWHLIKKHRASALLTFTVKPNVYGSIAAWSEGVPCVCNVTGLGTAFLKEDWVPLLVSRLYRFALSRAEHSFFQNSDHRDDFVARKLVPELRSSLLPGSGVDTERFAPRQKPEENQPVFRFLLFGRMLYDKGVGEFVQAARALKPRFPGVEFVLMGFLDAANRSAISVAQIDAWRSEGVIRFIEAKNDVRDVIADADCVVLPSYTEGMPRSLLEAAAMGKPIIASDIPGCRQIVKNGENGFLVAPRDSQSLAAAMATMLEMPARDQRVLGERARLRVEEEFDERIVVDRYRAVLRSLGLPLATDA